MSPEEIYCPEHGPYLAELGACPYCKPPAVSGGNPPSGATIPQRPAPPKPLDEGESAARNGAIAPPPPLPIPGNAEDAATMNPVQQTPPGSNLSPGSNLPPHQVKGGQQQLGYDPEATVPPKSRRPYPDEDEIEKTMDAQVDTSGLMGWLIVKSSPTMRRGQVLKIKHNSIWGRNPRRANIVLDDPRVSGEHARIRIENDAFTIADLDSTHGTFVNGTSVQGRKNIQQDDEIQMGDSIFVLKTLR
jgi:hypothetical protein